DYVHRVGRTGRMRREGIAFSFVAKGQGDMLTEIEHKINRLLEVDPLSESAGSVTSAAPKSAVGVRSTLARGSRQANSERASSSVSSSSDVNANGDGASFDADA